MNSRQKRVLVIIVAGILAVYAAVVVLLRLVPGAGDAVDLTGDVLIAGGCVVAFVGLARMARDRRKP